MARNYQKFWGLLTLSGLWLAGCQGNPPQQPTVTNTPKPTADNAAKPPEGTLERVKNRNKLICAVNGRLPGFSLVSDKGEWSGLDVDYCRAIAGAVLGDANAIELRPILAKDRFLVLQSGEVDVVFRNTSRTLTRDAQTNIAFGPTVFFDGQGLMQRTAPKPSPSPTVSPNPTPGASPTSTPTSPTVSPSPTVSATASPSPTPSPTSSPSATETKSSTTEITSNPSEIFKDIADQRICVETGNSVTTLETAFANRGNYGSSGSGSSSDMKVASKSDSTSSTKNNESSSDNKLENKSDNKSESKSEPTKTEAKTEATDKKLNLVVLPDLDSVITAYNKGECDVVSASKSQLAAWRSKFPKPSEHKILDVSFDKEPLSPIVVGNDDRWRNVVSWVIYATFYAEELGINQKNYTTFKDSKNPDISRFLGTTDSLGIEIGLAPDWTTQILKAVGNYSDIYERNLGPLEMPRGLNRSWKQGGLLYGMPFR